MGRFIVHSLAFIGLLFVLFCGGIAYLVWNSGGQEPTIPETAVLKLDLTRDVVDVAADNPLARLQNRTPIGFVDLLAAVERGAGDPRVRGLIADVGGVSMSFARIQELRDAIGKFRAAGKFAIAYARAMPGNKDLFTAAGFEQIVVEPMGGVGLVGLAAEKLFLRGTLDKIGIEPEVERRSDYKTAANQFLFAGYTPAEKEMIQSYLGSISSQMIEGIARGRGLSVDDVRAAIDRGPFTTEEALKAKLIDKIAYPDEVGDAALARANAGNKTQAKLINATNYAAALRAGVKETGTTIALVPASGMIVDDESGDDELSGQRIGGRALSAAIERAVDTDAVKAILLRVDSPGGSALGSDMIRHALVKAKKAGKPVVVSMSGVAASGGYWIAMAADAIIAEPATITGSIGVISLKPNVEKLAADLGATYDRITFGRNAAIGSIGKPFTNSERERMAAQTDEIYSQFKSGVAEGRNMTVEAVEKIAQGRVWSGAQGKDLGLVDQLGGIETAKAALREKLKLAADAPLKLAVYPKPQSFFEMARKAFSGKDDEDRASVAALVKGTVLDEAALQPMLREIRPFMRNLALSASGRPSVLTTLPVDFQ